MISPTPRRRAQLLAASASLVVVLAGSRAVQGLYSDPAQQLLAVQQRLAGESTSINRWRHPDSLDLSRDAGEWIVWWTPGTELFAYPLMRAGLSVGAAVRTIAAVTVVVGSVGWVTWFSLFQLPTWTLFALAAAFPFVRYASNGLFLYSAEMLVFAAAPWLLIVTRGFLERRIEALPRAAVRSLGLGVLLGSAYWLKGSMAFVAVGALVAIAVTEWRRDADLSRWLAVCAAAAAGVALPFFALTIVNTLAGSSSTNQVTQAFQWNAFGWRTVLDLVALPALQLADAGALWQYLLMHPAHPLVRDSVWLSLLGLPGGLVLFWLLCRPVVESGAAGVVARSVLFASLSLLAGIWSISVVSHEWRHLASGAFAVLPLLSADVRERAARSGPALRVALAGAAVFYVCVPLAYGVVSVVQKARRFPAQYQVGPARIYNPALSEVDVAAARASVLAQGNPGDVWYLLDPISALDLPVRAVITGADFRDLPDLRGDRFLTKRPVSVHALLPTRFEANGKGSVIRRSFPQAGRWTATPVAQSDYIVWSTDLRADR